VAVFQMSRQLIFTPSGFTLAVLLLIAPVALRRQGHFTMEAWFTGASPIFGAHQNLEE
jgi:hypothetical protein